jgi:enamine deaminase RidA (YjgF/YER057c/UK114 family)
MSGRAEAAPRKCIVGLSLFTRARLADDQRRRLHNGTSLCLKFEGRERTIMGLDRYDPFDGALGFSLGVRSGDAVHVAGMIGLDSNTLTVPDDIEGQMRVAYKNLADVLAHFGCTIADVATQTVFFVGDPESAVQAASAVRSEAFGNELPASAMIGVDRLVEPRYLVEIQATAYVRH